MLMPDQQTELLLQACFLRTGESALREWERATDLDTAAAETTLLLPLLKRHADQQGWQLQDAGRAVGMQRYQLARLSVMLQRLRLAVTALREQGIDLLVIGEAALALAVYPQRGLKAVNALTLLVHPAQQAAAVSALQRAGWSPHHHVRPHRLGMVDALSLNLEDTLLHLRWSLLDRCPLSDAPFWSRAKPLGYADWHTLAPEDHLLYVAARPAPPAIRIADIALLLRETTIDGSTLLHTARLCDRMGTVSAALKYAARLDLPLPDGFAFSRASLTEQVEMRLLDRGFPAWLAHAIRLQRQHVGTSPLRRPYQAARYTLRWHGVTSARSAVRRVIRRTLRRRSA